MKYTFFFFHKLNKSPCCLLIKWQSISDLHDDHFGKVLIDADLAFLDSYNIRAEKNRQNPYRCSFKKTKRFQMMAFVFIAAYFLNDISVLISAKFSGIVPPTKWFYFKLVVTNIISQRKDMSMVCRVLLLSKIFQSSFIWEDRQSSL